MGPCCAAPRLELRSRPRLTCVSLLLPNPKDPFWVRLGFAKVTAIGKFSSRRRWVGKAGIPPGGFVNPRHKTSTNSFGVCFLVNRCCPFLSPERTPVPSVRRFHVSALTQKEGKFNDQVPQWSACCRPPCLAHLMTLIIGRKPKLNGGKLVVAAVAASTKLSSGE